MNMKPALLPLLLLTLALHGLAPNLRAQVAGAPAFVDYQGTVFDGTSGKPLGSDTAGTVAEPKNYTMQFRIYDAPTAGTLIYAETQTVTVSLGQFAVRLGSGAAIGGLEAKGPPTVSISNAFNAKDRYLELTTIVPPATSGTPITPRLAFQSSPFAFVAERAKQADSATAVAGGAGSTFSGTVNATGGIFTSGTFGTAGAPATFTGNGAGITNVAGGNLQAGTVDVAKLALDVQRALCPPGTIMAYAGDTAPAGWLMCNGDWFHSSSYPALYAVIGTRFGNAGVAGYYQVPDFRGRFLRGRDGGAERDPDRATRTAMGTSGSGAVGDAVGSVQLDAFKSHTHAYTKPYIVSPSNDTASSFREVGDTEVDATTAATGGTETRPINAYVNYIIKY